MIRRLAVIVLAVVLLAGNIAAVDCAGWQSVASDRMACCVKAEHGCPDQLAADQCCAAGELAHQTGVTSASAAAPAPAVTVAALPPLLVAPAIHLVFRSLSDYPQSPPHLRRIVLLI